MKYQHDCNLCVPLGERGKFDLYFCPGANSGPYSVTVIARYGNDGSEYKSGLDFIELDPDLAEAADRAKKRGLL